MKINVPIIVDFNYVIIETLKNMTVESDDYMYLEGFFDCRDMMIQAIEEFMDKFGEGVNTNEINERNEASRTLEGKERTADQTAEIHQRSN